MSGSVAPKERINITYKAKTNNQESQIELPLKLMIVADLTEESDKPIEERTTFSINKNNFNDVMQSLNVKTNFSVNNKLGVGKDELQVNLNFSKLEDFSPDSIVNQVPELAKLMELRQALVALKGPMGNIPDFKKAVLDALKDKDSKKQLILEIENADK